MSFTTAAGFGIDRSIARSVGSAHRSGGHGDMSVSDLDEVLQMETFLLGIGRLNAYVFLRCPTGGIFWTLSGGMKYGSFMFPQ